MLIDTSYFTDGELCIENVVETDTPSYSVTSVNASLQRFIDTYEPAYLVRMLGCDVSRSLIAYLKREEGEKEDKWESLIKLLTGDISPIACYVYYFYTRASQTRVTGVGVVQNKSANPVVSANERLATAWNLMVTFNTYLVRWMEKHSGDYPGWEYDEDMLETINEFGI